jgi:Tfp pilus assembly protein PilN
VSLEEGSLALLLARVAWGRVEVAGALRLPLPAGAEDEASFLHELGKFVLASRIPPATAVVLGVPRGGFLLRRFETPPVKARTLPELVEFEIERHLPGKREEFLCGWRTEGKGAGGGHAVLLGAARREPLERAAALLRKANLAPTSIQPESLALAALCARLLPGPGPALLLQLGAAEAGVDLQRGGRVELSRTLALAEPLWRESFSAAPAAGEGAAEVRRLATERVADALVAQLTQPLFLAALPGGAVPEVRLAGLGANRALLVERLHAGLKAPVRALSPWPPVRWGNPPAELAPYLAPLALVRLAAAGERAGLELHEERQEALHRTPSLRLTAVLAALLVAVILAGVAGAALRRQRQLDAVDREIRTLKVKMAEVEVVNKRINEERARLRYLAATVRRRPRLADILRELTTLLPADSYLTEVSYKERGLEITGLSPAASRLLPVLENSPLFAGVEFSAPIVAQGGGLERFRIRMKLEQPGG